MFKLIKSLFTKVKIDRMHMFVLMLTEGPSCVDRRIRRNIFSIDNSEGTRESGTLCSIHHLYNLCPVV